jgi:GT2 family glycosyltransferase|tara:strand:- start:7506 stop:8291 length:786 start_codon:yes stop_codon:yes gene_type:complete
MKEKNEISVILPVFNADEIFLARAIQSVTSQKVLPDNLTIVVRDKSDDQKLVKKLTKDIAINCEIITNKGNSNFQAQFNLGVKECKTEWFIFLEQDDELSNIWIDNVIKYRVDNPDVTIFLPIIVEVTPEDNFMGFTNEPVWASQFCDEMGILDNAVLLRFQNFSIDGMAVLKEAYDDYGGLKESIKLSFIYEFLLRMTHNSCRVMVIPKNGYKHVNEREDALFSNYKKELSEDEYRWWLTLAKRECYHIVDREVLYEKKD